MSSPMFRRTTLALAAWIACSVPAHAQCPAWDPGFCFPGTNETVLALAAFDDGAGPALVAGGTFELAGDASGVAPGGRIAAWGNGAWGDLGGGVGATGLTAWEIACARVFDDGSGPALYVGGRFYRGSGSTPAFEIGRWDGTAWSTLAISSSPGSFVRSMAVFDDGGGPALYLASYGGGLLHRWDGTNLTTIPGTFGVSRVATLDDGSGEALYVAGSFASVGGQPALRIARWDGVAWTSFGAGLGEPPTPFTLDEVLAIATFDDGSGPALYAGGRFTTSGGAIVRRIARWNGAQWSEVGGGVAGGDAPEVLDLAVFDDGGGPDLYVAGAFARAGNVPYANVVRWDGAAWSGLASGADQRVAKLEVLDLGGGPRLVAGGSFHLAGGVAAGGVATWDGTAWSAFGSSVGGADDTVRALAAFDSGAGPQLHAAGSFRAIGSSAAQRVARWDGTAWHPLGSGADEPVRALASGPSSSGPVLYAGGSFVSVGGVVANRVAAWDGAGWSALGSGTDGTVHALCVFAGELYAGGEFSSPGLRIARWNGSTWNDVGGGVDGVSVRAMTVFDDGRGPALYVAGVFGTPGSFVARWDGASWSALGGGLGGVATPGAFALAVHDDGAGPALYVGGWFATAGGAPARNVARWDGAAWSALGAGTDGGGSNAAVTALASIDDGSGPALYAGGGFWTAGGVPAKGLARWDGSSWNAALGDLEGTGGADFGVRALAAFDDGTGAGDDLWVGGLFHRAGSVAAHDLAVWRGCADVPGNPFCPGDGSIAACPCANPGSAGHGCASSASPAGALLSSSGTTSPDTVVLTASGEPATALSIFLQGNTPLAPPVAFGDGLRCVGGALLRLYVASASGGVAAAPAPGDLSITVRSAQLGDPIAPGSTRWYQAYYRDPSEVFCPAPAGSTFNATNGVAIGW